MISRKAYVQKKENYQNQNRRRMKRNKGLNLHFVVFLTFDAQQETYIDPIAPRPIYALLHRPLSHPLLLVCFQNLRGNFFPI